MFRGADLLPLPEQRGVSRGAVSGRAGISRCTVSRLESNLRMPAIDSLVKLADSGTYSLVNQLLL
jgi:transcriptional regulator with XRE-family HTH domain